MTHPNTPVNGLLRPSEYPRHRKGKFEPLAEMPVQNDFTGLFVSCFYNIRAGLEEEGIRLRTNEVLAFILVREYLAAAGKIKITKREAYGIIRQYLDISFMTLNRLFNSLVMKHCFKPLGTRGNGKFGLSEEYVLTIVAKRMDGILKISLT